MGDQRAFDRTISDQWSDDLIKSLIGRKHLDSRKAIEQLNKASAEPWAAASYKVRLFFNKLYDQQGIDACVDLLLYTKEYPLLRTVLFSLLGHRHFDDGNVPGMRAAYRQSLDAAEHVPHYDVHTNRDKWCFSTNFYWARHDPDNTIKEQCLVRAMAIPIKNFHHELVTTKFIRALQWLIKNTQATEAITHGKSSMAQFLKDGRISQTIYDKAFTSIPQFCDAERGKHDFKIGNP
jgi:hypothetical protein